MTKRDLPKYVYRQRNGLYFQRRGWPTHKFKNQELNPEFYREYSDILSAKATKPPKHTFKALIMDYEKSHKFKKLSVRTKSDYTKYLGNIEDIFGKTNPSLMQRKDVIKLRESNADHHRQANYLVQVMRILMEHAIDLGWRSDNPARGVSMLKTPYDPRTHWPEELVEKFRKEYPYGTPERLLFELLIGTGQRIGDVLEMKWTDIAGDGINLRQNKTGKPMWIPFTDHLRAALAAKRHTSEYIVTQIKDPSQPWSYRGASQAMRKARENIEALKYDLHSLRYTTAKELLIAGCDDDLIAAVTGQSKEMVIKYTASVRQRIRAVQAQEKRK
ncbi:tyrosine-type recombinase/integrase [uncultured Ruegeria sp.]|uniref:tyrosine-type recombinase/integrase n=1 Tax=uncultured Ruegeria sp. TaxID=259304 RepID=UPI002620BAE8|nr:tyrosine-type recombinase/integrase [uncultured Ruegeria sp.]